VLTQNKIDLRGAANKVGSSVLPTLLATPNELRSLLFAGFLKWGANFVGSSTLSVRAKLPVGKNRQEARLRIYWNLFHPPMRQLNGPGRPIKQRHEEIQEKANEQPTKLARWQVYFFSGEQPIKWVQSWSRLILCFALQQPME